MLLASQIYTVNSMQMQMQMQYYLDHKASPIPTQNIDYNNLDQQMMMRNA